MFFVHSGPCRVWLDCSRFFSVRGSGGPRASEFAKAVFFDLNFVYTSKTPVFPKELAEPRCPPSVFCRQPGGRVELPGACRPLLFFLEEDEDS